MRVLGLGGLGFRVLGLMGLGGLGLFLGSFKVSFRGLYRGA